MRITATTIGMIRSLVEALAGWPLADGEGATDATAVEGVGAGEAAAVALGGADGEVLWVGAGA
jgi:hypothetical protein